MLATFLDHYFKFSWTFYKLKTRLTFFVVFVFVFSDSHFSELYALTCEKIVTNLITSELAT